MNKKDLIGFDIIIDDSLHNLTSGKMKLLFTAYHNKDISFEVLEKENIIRVNDWQEIAKILLED